MPDYDHGIFKVANTQNYNLFYLSTCQIPTCVGSEAKQTCLKQTTLTWRFKRKLTWWWCSAKGIKSSWGCWWGPKSIKEIGLCLWLGSRLWLLLRWGTKCRKPWLGLLSWLRHCWSKWIEWILSRSCWLTSKCTEFRKATWLWRWSKLAWENMFTYQKLNKHVTQRHGSNLVILPLSIYKQYW